jgi:hypothetical protein
MLGNKALARGLYEAGCSVVSSYPGTPSTEVTEEAAKYDEIYCEKCESSLCSCAMPDEIAQLCGCWEDIWNFINTDINNKIIPSAAWKGEDGKKYVKIFKKYLSVNDDYGLVLKEKYCPICQKRKEDEKDPEYKEYLRLKAKFES